MFGKFIIIIFIFCTSPFAWGQKIETDSAKIEKDFLSSIGQPAVIDSLEKIVFQKVNGKYRLEDTYWYNLSKVRFYTGQLDQSFEAAKRGVELNKRNKNAYRSAKFYNLKASVYAYEKDNQKAIQTFKTSLAILEEAGDKYTAAQIQNNIANIFFGLYDYKSAYKYSKLSYDQLSKMKDTVHLPGVTGVFAVCAVKLKRLVEGKKLAKKSLRLSTKYNNPIGLIVSNHSLGELYHNDKQYDLSISSFKESLKLSEMYRQVHFVMLNKLGLLRTYLEAKDFQKAIEIGQQALNETKDQKNENTLYSIHKHLGYAYDGLGQKDKGFYHLKLAHESYIKFSGVENQKAINDILIKYDTEKKEKELIASRLKNAESQNKLYKRLQWIVLLGTVLALVLISYFFYNRLQKERVNQLKKEQESKRLLAAISAEETERERISNELHDGMASTITGIKLKLEDLSMDENGQLLKPLVGQLQSLHDETRRMSHNLMPLGLNEVNWIERMEQYCSENSLPRFKILFNNNLVIPTSIPTGDSVLLYRSMQELIHNAQKYSQSSVCHVQVSLMQDELILTIEDEGIGFKAETADSQGLKSLRKRLSEINAEMEIDSQENKGTHITITLPI